MHRHAFLYTALFLLLLLGCHAPVEVVAASGTLDVISDTTLKDQSINEMLQPYKLELDAEMNEVIVISDIEMLVKTPESLLGNFVADLSLEYANDQNAYEFPVQVCLLNRFGLRAPLPEGEITRRHIFELMPFENELEILTINGEKMEELLAYIAKTGGQPVAGMQLTIEGENVSNATIQNKPFDPSLIYKVLTTDYLANGGDQMDFFQNPIKREKVGIKLRDAILIHCEAKHKNGEHIGAKFDGRVKYAH